MMVRLRGIIPIAEYSWPNFEEVCEEISKKKPRIGGKKVSYNPIYGMTPQIYNRKNHW